MFKSVNITDGTLALRHLPALNPHPTRTRAVAIASPVRSGLRLGLQGAELSLAALWILGNLAARGLYRLFVPAW